jgi:Asp/Glu/hydantoin racemase
MLVLLHTSPVHVPVFDALRDADHPGLRLRHVVREDLLVRARADGPDAVTDELAGLLRSAAADGADAVLCTCSSIGGVAEHLAGQAGVPVLRLDRPMAARAVATGPRITVLATTHSTLGPTVALIEDEAARAGRRVEVTAVHVDGAWELFLAGEHDAYLDRVAAALDAIGDTGADAGPDVMVLAQASIAGAAHRTRTSVPVLSSPRPGLAAAAAAATAAVTGRDA